MADSASSRPLDRASGDVRLCGAFLIAIFCRRFGRWVVDFQNYVDGHSRAAPVNRCSGIYYAALHRQLSLCRPSHYARPVQVRVLDRSGCLGRRFTVPHAGVLASRCPDPLRGSSISNGTFVFRMVLCHGRSERAQQLSSARVPAASPGTSGIASSEESFNDRFQARGKPLGVLSSR